jgi:O-antigen ligase
MPDRTDVDADRCARMIRRLRAVAIGWFFFAIGCYTMLAPIDGPLPIGAPVLSRSAAIVLAATIVLAGLICAGSLLGAFRDTAVAGARPVYGLWIGALAVAAVFSFLPARSWEFFGLALLSAGAGLAIVRWWRDPLVARALLRIYLWGGLALAAIALLMEVTHRPGIVYAANLGRATGLFVTPNQFAAWLVPFFATAGGVALAARSRPLRALAATGAVLAAIDLGLTFSVGGWMGGLAAILFALAWTGRPRIAAAGTIVAVVLIAVAVTNPAIVRHRQSERFIRLDALHAGAHLAALFPLTGVGPLAYQQAYPLVRVPSSTEDAAIGEHPHDLILSLLAETGILGLVAIAAGWTVAARAIVSEAARQRTAYVWFPFAALLLALARDGWVEDAG